MNSVGTRRKHVLYFIRVSLLRHVTDLQDGDCDSSHFYEKQQMVGACFLCWLLTWRPSLGSYNLADLRQLLNYAKVTVFVILSSSGDTSDSLSAMGTNILPDGASVLGSALSPLALAL